MAKSKNSQKEAPVVRLQFAALPYRLDAMGGTEILLVTSRGTRRWIIPKGWPMNEKKPSGTAAREAYEEAGLNGEIENKAIGAYRYDKYLDGESRTVSCLVKVFPLKVKRQSKDWPEARQRLTRWFAAHEAAKLVNDEGLTTLILAFDEKMRKHQKTEKLVWPRTKGPKRQ